MAIHKNIISRWQIQYTPVCDGCGDTLQEEYDFDDAVSAKLLAGWRSRKICGMWQDYCQECLRKYDHESAVRDFAGIGRMS